MAQCEFIKDDVFYNGDKVSGRDPIGVLCRQLQGSGVSKLEAFRDGVLSMTFDVQTRSTVSLCDTDKGLVYREYEPFDFTALKGATK